MRDAAGTATEIPPGEIGTLAITFWILVALSFALYVASKRFGGRRDRLDWIRATIAPLAFVGWTMLQRPTVFDAAFPSVEPVTRTIIALIMGAVLGAVTAGLASVADAKPPTPTPAPDLGQA